MESEPSGFAIALTILASLASFCVIWIAVIWLLSEISGWRALSRTYGTDREVPVQVLRLQSGQMRWVGINRCLNIAADGEGLYLSMLPIFAIFHPPLFVPWGDITTATKNKWIRKGMEFRLGRDPGVPLWLETGLAERLRQNAS